LEDFTRCEKALSIWMIVACLGFVMAAVGTGTAGINCTKQKGGIGKIFAAGSFGRTLLRSHGYALLVMGYHTMRAWESRRILFMPISVIAIEMVNVVASVL